MSNLSDGDANKTLVVVSRHGDHKFIRFLADAVFSLQASDPQDLLSRSGHNNDNTALGRFVAGRPSTLRSQNDWLLAPGNSGTAI